MESGEGARARRAAGHVAALGLGLGLALGAGARAEPQRLVLDPDASEIAFALGATLHTVRGSLRLASGEVALDLESGAISGRVVLDAASARTGIDARDRRMHEEVLESARHPEIAFLPRALRVLRREGGELEAEVAGAVRIRGLECEITLPLRVRIAQGGRAEIEGDFMVPYVRWGLRDVSTLLLRVDPQVEVSLRARGRLAPDPPAAAPAGAAGAVGAPGEAAGGGSPSFAGASRWLARNASSRR
jgi:polyisoprenoid-binding protein YceI